VTNPEKSVHPEKDELMAWQDREIAMPRAAEIAAHVGECAQCAGEVRRFAGASAAINKWRVDAPPAAEPPTASQAGTPAARTSSRRPLYWAAAAVIVVGLLSTVRVECAAAPTCDHPRLHFSFLPSSPAPGFSTGAQRGTSAAAQSAFERDWNTRRRLPIGIPAQGEQVLVVIFLDWQCPACRAVHGTYLPIVDALNREHPGAIRVVMRDYPLNMRCNPNVPVEMHPAACEAAVAVRLAREKHRDAEMINWLFARQEQLTPALVRQGASDVAGVTDLAARYPVVIKEVLAEVDLGRRLEVGGTPTVFVNGVLARTPDNLLFSPQQFEMALRAEIKKK
jgi:protein-disulfide isomerase